MWGEGLNNFSESYSGFLFYFFYYIIRLMTCFLSLFTLLPFFFVNKIPYLGVMLVLVWSLSEDDDKTIG